MNTVLLLQIAIIILVSMMLQKFSLSLGAPYLLALLTLGLLFGNYGIISLGYIGYPFAQRSCEVALIFIMFYGGFDTRWRSAKKVLAEASLLSTLGVVITAGLTALFCHYVIKWAWGESCIMGAILSSTDAASVFNILKAKRLNLKDNLTSLIEVESGSNDPISHMLTLTVISVISGTAAPGSAVLHVFLEISLGLGLGILIAKGAAYALRHMSFSEGFISMLFFAIAILAYAIPEAVGGNGFLSVYVVGLLLGKESFSGKKAIVHFFEGMTSLMEMVLFFILGALARPASLVHSILPALAIFAFLFLISRPAAVNLLLLPMRKYGLAHRTLLSFAGPRGAAAIVFAVVVLNSLAPEKDIINIVFCIVVLSMAIQVAFLPLCAKKLNLIDKTSSNMLSFNEFAEEDQLQFGKFEITENSKWLGRTVGEAGLPEGISIAMVIRGNETLIPRSDLVLNQGDTVITLTRPFDETGAMIKEKIVKTDSRRVGHPIKDYPGRSKILLVKRDDKSIIPDDDTILQAGDHLVILELQS